MEKNIEEVRSWLDNLYYKIGNQKYDFELQILAEIAYLQLSF